MPGINSFAMNALAQGYQFSGQPGRAVLLFRRIIKIAERENDQRNLSISLTNLSLALCLTGALQQAEVAARRALIITREREERFGEAISLQLIGTAMSYRGAWKEGEAALRRGIRIFQDQSEKQSEGVANANLAESLLLRGSVEEARRYADLAWELASVDRLEADFIRSARLQGTLMGNGAEERLVYALTRARKVQMVEQELPALVALAKRHMKQGELARARELLEDVWEPAERGPYPTFHCDALLVLASLEQDAEKKAEAAEKAYRKAWCDGPPYAYHWGLEQAKALLGELGAPEPEMPPFDPSMHEKMPDVEINPPGDKFSP